MRGWSLCPLGNPGKQNVDAIFLFVTVSLEKAAAVFLTTRLILSKIKWIMLMDGFTLLVYELM